MGEKGQKVRDDEIRIEIHNYKQKTFQSSKNLKEFYNQAKNSEILQEYYL